MSATNATPVEKSANRFAKDRFSSRLNANGKFKINGKKFMEEMELSYTLGEFSGAERILNTAKKHPELSLDEFIGEVEIYLTKVNKIVREKGELGQTCKVTLDTFH